MLPPHHSHPLKRPHFRTVTVERDLDLEAVFTKCREQEEKSKETTVLSNEDRRCEPADENSHYKQKSKSSRTLQHILIPGNSKTTVFLQNPNVVIELPLVWQTPPHAPARSQNSRCRRFHWLAFKPLFFWKMTLLQTQSMSSI